jgi:hypothetical protein
VAVTGWTPGSIGVLAGAVMALAAMARGSRNRDPVRWRRDGRGQRAR